MLFDISIDTNADRVALRMTPEGETFGAGSYLNTTPTKKGPTESPVEPFVSYTVGSGRA